MSTSYTLTEVLTFTLTHAKHMAAKVATDLKRMQRFYGYPSDSNIASYEAEVIELVKAGYLEQVTYGFKRNGQWIEPTLRYEAKDLYGVTTSDDDPGKVRPGLDISNATFYTYLTRNSTWHALSPEEQAAFEKRLPFTRTGAPEPTVNGIMTRDLTYSSGGRSLNRSSVRSY